MGEEKAATLQAQLAWDLAFKELKMLKLKQDYLDKLEVGSCPGVWKHLDVLLCVCVFTCIFIRACVLALG